MALITETLKGYAHWASYFINGDASVFDGCNASEEDAAQDQGRADRWLAQALDYTGADYGPVGCGEGSFFGRPDFGGLPGDVLEYHFLVDDE